METEILLLRLPSFYLFLIFYLKHYIFFQDHVGR